MMLPCEQRVGKSFEFGSTRTRMLLQNEYFAPLPHAERCRPQHRWTTAIVFDPTQTTLSWYVATSRRSQGRAWRALAEFGNLLLD